jgi:hypothetical protein
MAVSLWSNSRGRMVRVRQATSVTHRCECLRLQEDPSWQRSTIFHWPRLGGADNIHGPSKVLHKG